MSRLTPIIEDSHHVVASFDNVLVAYWRGPHQAGAVGEEILSLANRLVRQQGTKKIAAVSIIGPGSRAPSVQVREALKQLHEQLEHIVHRTALVYPGGGFAEAAIRSVVLGLRRRVARLQDQAVFQKLNEALLWVTDGLTTAHGRPIDNCHLSRSLVEYLDLQL